MKFTDCADGATLVWSSPHDIGSRVSRLVASRLRPRSAGRARRRSRWGPLVGAAAAAVLFGACSSPATTTDTADGDLGLSHVHGLGVNPSDGYLYVASHYGVFRLSDGTLDRAGPLIQDTMGFTVAGADQFLGSGHPDMRNDTILSDGDRPLLGLIESTDRASTWQGLSLQGEVDFHTLAFAHGRVYGYDSTGGHLLVSNDRRTWDTRSPVPISSVAVSPTDADALIATGETAVLVSADGGRTWVPIPEAPRLVVVSWDPTVGLWGVAADGGVYRSNDAGLAWERRGAIEGQPAALLAHPSALFAATDTGLFRSDDQGATWVNLVEVS